MKKLFYFLIITIYTVLPQTKPELILPVGHKNKIDAVSYSPDGKLILSASWDNTVKLWDAETGVLLRNIEAHREEVSDAQFSPDGSLFFTLSWDQSIKLWETVSGKLIHNFFTEGDAVTGASFSPDGKRLLITGYEGRVEVRDLASGNVIFPLIGHSGSIETGRFSSDGKLIVTIAWDGTVKVWDSQTGALIHSLPTGINWPVMADFSSDTKYFFSAAYNGTVRLWETSTGKMISEYRGIPSEQNLPVFSPDSKNFAVPNAGDSVNVYEIATGANIATLYLFSEEPCNISGVHYSDDGSKLMVTFFQSNPTIWRTADHELLQVIFGMEALVGTANFNPDGNSAVFGDYHGKIITVDVESGKQLSNLAGKTVSVNSANFNPDGDKIVATYDNDSLKILDVLTGKARSINPGESIVSWFSGFSPDGKKILIPGMDYSLVVIDVNSGEVKNRITGHDGFLVAAEFSPESDKIVSVTMDSSASLWNLTTNKEEKNLSGVCGDPSSIAFSPDGKKIAVARRDSTTSIIDLATGKVTLTLYGHTSFVNSARFNKTGNKIVTASLDQTVKVWDAISGKELLTLYGHTYSVTSAYFDDEGNKIISFGEDKQAIIWDVNSGEILSKINLKGLGKDVNFKRDMVVSHKNSLLTFYDLTDGYELLSFATFGTEDWFVTHPSGLFDASPGAMEQMYYVQGLDIIEFNQLKDKYWEPGLFKKIMNSEQLRSVAAIDKEIELWPEVKEFEFSGNYEKVNVTVENKGGGIGKIQVLLNGKEMIADARGPELDVSQNTALLSIDLKNHPYLVNGDNKIEIITWNKDGNLSSPGDVADFLFEKEKLEPAIFIVSVGVGDYTGEKLDLKYAGKDAGDIFTALNVGAQHLFSKERTFSYLLSTDNKPGLMPTKVNIIKTFNEIAKKASSEDVIVVYLAGHGMNLGGEEGDLHYLTQDAFSANPEVYKDESVRKSTTISGVELIELLKNVAALKQVLIIDACASGKLVDNLAEKRDISSSVIKAMERMKDRTGLHIITGSAADAVSYEASKYGQGLLTYSILSGMRGLALKDNRSVDISLLMQHAREMVPKLAEGIGGIQEPRIFSPKGAESFDIGILDDKEKSMIPLSQEKAIFINSVFMDITELSDHLNLAEQIDEKLSGISEKSGNAKLIFWDVKSYPGANKLSGTYSLSGDNIEITFKILQDKNTIKSFTKKGTKSKLDQLINDVIVAVVESMK